MRTNDFITTLTKRPSVLRNGGSFNFWTKDDVKEDVLTKDNCDTTKTNILPILRDLVPETPVSYAQALRIAELQANKLRRLLKVNSFDFPSELWDSLPRIKIIYEAMPAPTSASVHWDGEDWLITVNTNDTRKRQLFSLAHEYKHVLDHYHRDVLYNDCSAPPTSKQAEKAADYFAGCLLVPKSDLKYLFTCGMQHSDDLARVFKVSSRTIKVRLGQTKLVHRVSRYQFMAMTARRRIPKETRVLQRQKVTPRIVK